MDGSSKREKCAYVGGEELGVVILNGLGKGEKPE